MLTADGSPSGQPAAPRPKAFPNMAAGISGRSFAHSVSAGLPSSLALAVAACENDVREAAAILGRLPRLAQADIVNRRVWCDSLNKVLLAERPPDRLDDPQVYEATMLGLASLGGGVEMVRLLLEAGADPSAKDSRGRTPLMCTIFAPVDSHEINATNLNYATLCLPKHVDVAEILLQSLANTAHYHDVVDSTQNGEYLRGITPLCLAAYLGKLALCDVLLASGAEVDSGDENGATPLMYAARDGHYEVAKLLLSYNARPDLIDRYGWSPVRYAAQFPEVGGLLEQALRDQKIANLDIQSMFRNADYVLQEITAITEGTPVIRSAWQSSSPASQSPKREAERRPEPFSDLPSLADLQGSDPDDSVASIEGVFADAAKYEMTAQALEAQRDRLQEQLIEKDRQLELAESKLRAVYQAYCSLADWTNSLIGTGAAYDPASESEEQIGSAGSTAAPSSDVEASQADSALPTPLVAPIFPLAPVQPEAQDPPASKLVRKPSFPDLRAQAFPETQPARGLSIFGAAKLGKAADKPAFNFRSPLQLLGMEKRDDGDSPLSSLLEQFSFGKTAAPEAKKAKAVPPSPAHSTASVATVVSAPATEPVAAKPADMASVSPAKRPSDQENAPPALTIVGAADAAPAAAEDAFGERRRKKRQAPVLLDYAGGFDVAIASAVGAFDAYGSLVPPPRNSSRKPGTHSAAAAPEAVQEEQSAIILSSPSESFRPSSMDFREVVTISQPSNSPNPKPSELAPAPPRRPSAMRMQARLDMAPAVVTVATEVRDKVEPVLAPAPEISRVSLSPPPPEPVPAEPVAADDFPKEPPAPAKEATAPTPPAGPLMPSQVKAMEAAKAKQSDAKPAAKPKDPAAKRKRVVRKPAGRGAAIDLYAYSGTLSATSDESGNPAALVDQISMNFRDMKNL